eukprot:gene3947-4319_t
MNDEAVYWPSESSFMNNFSVGGWCYKGIEIITLTSGHADKPARQIPRVLMSSLLESRPQYKIILANRSKEKTLKAFEYLPSQYKTRTQFEELDLADLSSIRAFAQRWGNEPIDCLALNAGLSFAKGQSPAYTKEGYELTVGTNHLGHFLLLNLLLPNVAKSPEGRIVFTASSVHNPEERGGDVGLPAGLKDMKGLKSNLKAPNNMIDGSEYDPDKAYKDSKLCNVLTCLELNQRLKQDPKYSHVTANCFNPGLVPTSGLFRYQNPFFSGIFSFLMRNVFKLAVSEEKAGSRLVYMIDSADLRGKTGRYFTAKASDDQLYEVTPSREAQDVNKAKQLWQISEGLVGL